MSEFKTGNTVTVEENSADSMGGNASDTGVITSILEDSYEGKHLYFVTFADWGDYFEARHMKKKDECDRIVIRDGRWVKEENYYPATGYTAPEDQSNATKEERDSPKPRQDSNP